MLVSTGAGATRQCGGLTRSGIESDSEVYYQLDGDPGGTLPPEIVVQPNLLRLFVKKRGTRYAPARLAEKNKMDPLFFSWPAEKNKLRSFSSPLLGFVSRFLFGTMTERLLRTPLTPITFCMLQTARRVGFSRDFYDRFIRSSNLFQVNQSRLWKLDKMAFVLLRKSAMSYRSRKDLMMNLLQRISLVTGFVVALGFMAGLSRPKDVTDEIMPMLGLKSGELVTIDQEQVGKSEMAMTMNGQDYMIDYTLHSNRSKQFRLLVQQENGELVEQEAPVVRTIRGTLRGVEGSGVVGCITENGCCAKIKFPSGDCCYIEPVNGTIDNPSFCRSTCCLHSRRSDSSGGTMWYRDGFG